MPSVLKRYRRSLALLGVLGMVFVLMIVLTPRAGDHPWLGIVLFCGLLGVYKLMSQFEMPRK